jgi:hypothetical protein
MNALARDLSSTAVTISSANSPQDVTAELLREIFRERCEARAILCEAAELNLHEAVDELQANAERTGLIDMIGQDAVQQLMSEAFAKVPRAGELEAAFAELADALEAPRPRSGVAPSTLMSAEYLLREKDMKRLQAWLASHSAAERIAIRAYLKAKQ